MPRLPDISQLGRRPVPQDRGGIATQNTTAPGLAMAQVGQVIGQIGEEIQKKNDEQAVFEARRKLDQWERDTLYDAEKGVVAKRGVDALELPNKVPQDYDKFAGEVASTLTTNRQRKVFQDMAQSRRNQVADFTIRHATQQKEVYERSEMNATLASSSERAIALATNGDTAAARAELDVSGARLMSYMKVRGAPGEEISMALKANASGTHEAVVRSLVNKGDPLAAKAYFEANSAGMLEKDKLQAGGLLKQGLLLSKSQEAADKIVPQFGDIAKAMKHIEDNFDGEEEKAVKHEVTERMTRNLQAKNLLSQNAYETALLATVQGQRVPAEAWLQMDDGHKAAIIEKREAEAKARRAEAEGNPIKTDFAAWDNLNRMVTADRAGFASLDLGRFADRISVQDRMEFANIQRDIRAGGGKSLDVVTLQQQISTTVGQLKLTGANNAERRGQLEHAIVTEIRAKQQETGGKLNDEDRQKIIDKNVMQMAVPGKVWGTNEKPLYQLTPEERAKAKVVVPDGDRTLITEALRAKGRPVNDEEILKLYKRQKGIQ